VTDAALDLRPAELGVIVPLVACLLALSVWPAAISGHSFVRKPQPTEAVICFEPACMPSPAPTHASVLHDLRELLKLLKENPNLTGGSLGSVDVIR
jgi:hypothetical protein